MYPDAYHLIILMVKTDNLRLQNLPNGLQKHSNIKSEPSSGWVSLAVNCLTFHQKSVSLRKQMV